MSFFLLYVFSPENLRAPRAVSSGDFPSSHYCCSAPANAHGHVGSHIEKLCVYLSSKAFCGLIMCRLNLNTRTVLNASSSIMKQKILLDFAMHNTLLCIRPTHVFVHIIHEIIVPVIVPMVWNHYTHV